MIKIIKYYSESQGLINYKLKTIVRKVTISDIMINFGILLK